MIYITHFCKGTREQKAQARINPKTGKTIFEERCNNAWVDEDTNNAAAPPTWKYCPQCESGGYVSPETKPINEKLSGLAKNRKWGRV